MKGKPPLRGFTGSHLYPLLLVALACVLPYANSLNNSFVFDDENSITINPLIKNLSNFLPGEAGWKQYPTRMIGYLSFAANYRFGDLDPFGYHAVNIAIHFANAMLIYGIVYFALRTPFLCQARGGMAFGILPLLTAILFSVHPVQTESVSYVVQRLASLSTMFCLGSLLAYARARLGMSDISNVPSGRPAGWYIVSLTCALLAMKTKEIAITLPAILTFFECMFFGGKWRKRIFLLLPYCLIALVIPLSLIRVDQDLGTILSDASDVSRLQTDLPRTVYLFTQFRVIVTYLRILIMPIQLNLDYDYPVFHTLYDPVVLLSLLLILLLFGSAILLLLKSARANCALLRLPAFGIFWFFVALSVESSIIPIRDVIFEHRLYLPSGGAFLALASMSAFAFDRISMNSKRSLPTALCVIVVILVLASGTYKRNEVWRNNLTLWEDVVRKSPGKARPRYNLGLALSVRGRTEEAIEQYLWSLRLRPNYPQAWDNLGMDYAKIGLVEKAIEAHEKAAMLDPSFPQPYCNLGRIYLTAFRGKEEDAAALFRKALSLKPDFVDAWVNLAAASIRSGKYPEGAQAAQRGVALAPDRPDAHYNLAVALFKGGDRQGATSELEIVKRLDPKMGNALEYYLYYLATSSR